MDQRGIDQDILRLLETIERDRWMVVTGVDARAGEPPFSYTVGLTALGHPELIVTGLNPSQGKGVLSAATAQVACGTEFAPGERYAHILDAGYRIGVRSCGTAHLSMARAIYLEPRALQILWPDQDDRLPGESGFEPSFAAMQFLVSRETA